MNTPASILIFGLAMASAFAQAGDLPSAPEFAIHEQRQVLRPEARSALQSVLIEHDRLTGEQIIFAVIDEPELSDLKQRGRELYAHWRIGRRGRGVGLLVLVNIANEEVAHEAGYGFTAILGNNQILRIMDETTRPALDSHDVSTALVETALELLQALESPLVASGELGRILSAVPQVERPDQEIAPAWIWITLLLLGAGIAWATLHLITEPDAHYTSSGWSRAYPGEIWKKLRTRKSRPSPPTGGTHGEW